MAKMITIHAAEVRGIEALPVDVEVMVKDGLSRLDIIGLQGSYSWDTAARIRSAIRVSGFSMPRESVTVNLSPASLPKAGTCFDLPIAVGILAATGQIPSESLGSCLLSGELSAGIPAQHRARPCD